jgi:hypothetical protein
MTKPETKVRQYTPGSVPLAHPVKVYYAADVEAAGDMDSFMKSIGSDKAKPLPEIDFSEEEWMQMLKTDL